MAEEEKEAIELPAPTGAPLFFAVGLAFLGASLVTNVIFAYVGLITAVLGAIGWWREMLPREHKESVPAQPLSERAPAIVPRTGAVEHLVIGEDGHRVRLPLEYHPYAAGLKAGIAGGIAMAIMGGIQGLVTAGTPWAAFNGFASIVMPLFGAAPPPDMTSFHAGNHDLGPGHPSGSLLADRSRLLFDPSHASGKPASLGRDHRSSGLDRVRMGGHHSGHAGRSGRHQLGLVHRISARLRSGGGEK